MFKPRLGGHSPTYTRDILYDFPKTDCNTFISLIACVGNEQRRMGIRPWSVLVRPVQLLSVCCLRS